MLNLWPLNIFSSEYTSKRIQGSFAACTPFKGDTADFPNSMWTCHSLLVFFFTFLFSTKYYHDWYHHILPPILQYQNKETLKKKKKRKKSDNKDFLVGPVAKSPRSQCRGLGSIPGQGTRSCMLQLKIPHAATKTEDPMSATKDLVQPNKYFF